MSNIIWIVHYLRAQPHNPLELNDNELLVADVQRSFTNQTNFSGFLPEKVPEGVTLQFIVEWAENVLRQAGLSDWLSITNIGFVDRTCAEVRIELNGFCDRALVPMAYAVDQYNDGVSEVSHVVLNNPFYERQSEMASEVDFNKTMANILDDICKTLPPVPLRVPSAASKFKVPTPVYFETEEDFYEVDIYYYQGLVDDRREQWNPQPVKLSVALPVLPESDLNQYLQHYFFDTVLINNVSIETDGHIRVDLGDPIDKASAEVYPDKGHIRKQAFEYRIRWRLLVILLRSYTTFFVEKGNSSIPGAPEAQIQLDALYKTCAEQVYNIYQDVRTQLSGHVTTTSLGSKSRDRFCAALLGPKVEAPEPHSRKTPPPSTTLSMAQEALAKSHEILAESKDSLARAKSQPPSQEFDLAVYEEEEVPVPPYVWPEDEPVFEELNPHPPMPVAATSATSLVVAKTLNGTGKLTPGDNVVVKTMTFHAGDTETFELSYPTVNKSGSQFILYASAMETISNAGEEGMTKLLANYTPERERDPTIVLEFNSTAGPSDMFPVKGLERIDAYPGIVPHRKPIPADLVSLNVLGDGNCLFYAFMVAASVVIPHEIGVYNVNTLRKNVEDIIQTNPRFDALFETPNARNDYVTLMRGNGQWGGQFEIIAMSSLFKVNIEVFRTQTNQWDPPTPDNTPYDHTVYLLVTGTPDRGHYKAIMRKGDVDKIPQQFKGYIQ